MPNWKTLSKEIVYQTNWIKVFKNRVVDHRGNEITYSFVELPHPAVVIVPMNNKGEIFLQKQYRYTIGRDMWEVPAGGSDGEDFLVAAKRELKEETGMVSSDWEELGEYYVLDGSGNCNFHIFLARGAESEGHGDGIEDIVDSRFFSIAEITDMIQSGELICSDAISAITMAMIKINSGKGSAWLK